MNKEQLAASDPSCSVWVSASAGTGKTRVLVNRFLRLLLSGVAPSKILCLTYTKAAAFEMKTRIMETLESWSVIPDSNLARELSILTGNNDVSDSEVKAASVLYFKVIDSESSLRISTIHSFCQSILKNFPLEAGISPSFSLIDDLTFRELLQESKQILFDKYQNDEEVIFASYEMSEYSFDSMMGKLIFSAQKMKDLESEAVLKSHLREFLGLDENDNIENIQENFIANTDFKTLRRFSSLLLDASAKSDLNAANQISEWLQSEDKSLSKYRRIFLTSSGEPKARVATQSFLKKHDEFIDFIAGEQRRILDFEEKIKSIKTADLSVSLIKTGKILTSIYNDIKEARAVLDFNDLLEKTLNLLENSEMADWVLYKLDGGIDHILTDESQDTNPLQWKILKAICTEFYSGITAREINRTLFVVGDEKQSIFGFQGAAPTEFVEMLEYFTARAEEAKKRFIKVKLDLSYRTTPQVLELVDRVFASAEMRNAISLTEAEITHSSFRAEASGIVEILPLITDDKEDDEAGEEEGQKESELNPFIRTSSAGTIVALAEQVADKISDILNSAIILPSRKRPVKPQDIMILLRKRDVLSTELVSSLNKRNIPVAGMDRISLSRNLAVMDMLAAMRFVLLPEDDYNTACLLKSGLIGVSEDELYDICHARGDLCVYEMARSRFATLDDLLEIYREVRSPYDFLSMVLLKLEGLKSLQSRLGVEVLDVVNELLSLAIAYENSHNSSILGFLEWFDKGNVEIKRDMESEESGVRILTVHSSKGLQAPIVIIPDSPSRRPYSVNEYEVLTSAGNKISLWSKRKEDEPAKLRRLREIKEIEANNEEMRLLYVALTRAEDNLYIAGRKTFTASNTQKSWYDCINF